MTLRRSALAAALAAASLAAPWPGGGRPWARADEAASGAAGLPAEALEGLSAEQRRLVAAWSEHAFCYCGCPHTLARCVREHGTCRHAPRMVALAARLVRAGARSEPELAKLVGDYYASFDRRAKLDTARFGPPLGSADAPISMVEFSDFTCPYCALVRPLLESFVEAHRERVKLFHKPFPIESHPGALEAAQAAEWARDAGLFWPMHEALFEARGAHAPDELAALARELGGDPDALRAALDSGKHLPRIRQSQAEARAAGIRGTPTLFLDGRMVQLFEPSAELLELTLEDEEEWREHRGWRRD